VERSQIRQATLSDAESVFALIQSNRDLLVPRSMGNIVENIDRFVVAERDGEVVGSASYQIHPEIGDTGEAATVEIKSVAVKSEFRRHGVGRDLVEAVIRKVEAFSPREVLVLTFTPEFFRTLGFDEIPKTKVMHKLYTGCINCTKHANPFTCPEIAMTRSVGKVAK
jgi:amino-acid N-acetyltransferase